MAHPGDRRHGSLIVRDVQMATDVGTGDARSIQRALERTPVGIHHPADVRRRLHGRRADWGRRWAGPAAVQGSAAPTPHAYTVASQGGRCGMRDVHPQRDTTEAGGWHPPCMLSSDLSRPAVLRLLRSDSNADHLHHLRRTAWSPLARSPSPALTPTASGGPGVHCPPDRSPCLRGRCAGTEMQRPRRSRRHGIAFLGHAVPSRDGRTTRHPRRIVLCASRRWSLATCFRLQETGSAREEDG